MACRSRGRLRSQRDILCLKNEIGCHLDTNRFRILNELHRDIKPANILITKSGYAKLADFGSATLAEDVEDGSITSTVRDKWTKPGMVIGTIAYMSPEQASGQKLDTRSDIFSFGVVLYELLAGRRPATTRACSRSLTRSPHLAQSTAEALVLKCKFS